MRRKCEYGVFQITNAKNLVKSLVEDKWFVRNLWHEWFGKPHTHEVMLKNTLPTYVCEIIYLENFVKSQNGHAEKMFAVHIVYHLPIYFSSLCRDQVRKASVQKTMHGWSKIYLWSRKVCIQGRKVEEFQPYSDPSDFGLEETMYKTQKYGQKINLLRFTLWPTFT